MKTTFDKQSDVAVHYSVESIVFQPEAIHNPREAGSWVAVVSLCVLYKLTNTVLQSKIRVKCQREWTLDMIFERADFLLMAHCADNTMIAKTEKTILDSL